MSSRYLDALGFVLLAKIEGGFSNDPADRGGPTNLGISLRAVRGLDADRKLSAFLRAELDVDDDGDLDIDDVKGWTRATAEKFYRAEYWDAVRGDLLPWPLSLIMFDAAVNQGAGAAIKVLQRVLRVTEDGVIGPATIAAANRAHKLDPQELCLRVVVGRLDRYRHAPTVEAHFRGWAARMLNLHAKAMREVA